MLECDTHVRVFVSVLGCATHLVSVSVADGVDEGVEVEGGQVGVLGLDEDDVGRVVLGQVHVARHAVVQVGERDLVLRAQRVSHDDLVHVVKLVPVLVTNTSAK